MTSIPPQMNTLERDTLGRSRIRKNRIFLIVLLTFVVVVFSFSFIHLAKETGRSVPVGTPQQPEQQGG